MSVILAIWGQEKTGKTTLALSAPKPIRYFEFDIGGYDRAKDGQGVKKLGIDMSKVIHSLHLMPLQAQIKLLTPTVKGAMESKLVIGMKELWYSYLTQYITALDQPDIQTIVLDTFTVVWEICGMAYLQEKQEGQFDSSGKLPPSERIREQLKQIEYKEPNTRMRAILYLAKSKKKNLILVHHARDGYISQINADGRREDVRSGKQELAGWGYIGDIADVIVRTDWKSEPNTTITLCGLAPKATGIEIENATYDDIFKRVNFIRMS